ncbi:MAG: GDP-mannose 4,6-dehydratase, partial [Candidatus Omnitrophota bacterium]
MKKVLITGIDGQDGSYLSEFLLKKGYEVHGIVRRVALEDPEHQLWRIRHILKKITLHPGSLESFASLFKVVHKIKPNECYHLAAQSFVSYSFEDEFSTINTNVNGTHYVLAAIKELAPRCKFYFAASSEMFGKVRETPQNEDTPFHPRSPYGISKVAGFDLTRNYREGYGLFACSGILFNHETVASFMPMFCKKTGEEEFDIKPITEIVPFDKTVKQYQSREVSGICVWGKGGWVEVRHASAYPHEIVENNKKPRFINSRSGAVMATSSHVGFMNDGSEK